MNLIEIQFFTPARIKTTDFQPIPKKIYQTWKTRFVTPKIATAIQNIINANPSYDYYFFGDDECKEYLKQNYPPNYEQAFTELVPGAFKSDFWRYAILAKEGGVYLDLDLKPFFPMDYLLTTSDFVTIKDRVKLTNATAIYQAFIATIPNHPFLIQTLKMCLNNIQTHFYGRNALCPTGPVLMGNAVAKCLNTNNLKIGSFKNTKFGNYKIYLFAGIGDKLFPVIENGEEVVYKTDKNCIVNEQNVEIFDTDKIEGYVETNSYDKLFHSKKIYHSPDKTNLIQILFYMFLILIVIFIYLKRKKHYTY